MWETAAVYETPEDLERLQALLDRSYQSSGAHMRTIITPARRLDAKGLAKRLTGVRVLSLATVTADARPLVAPVDGLFYRGEWWFGSADDSVRFAHIRARPQVSATYAEGEEYSVSVHGTAVEIDLAEHPGFTDYCIEIYGKDWAHWGAPYARINADKIFTFVAPV